MDRIAMSLWYSLLECFIFLQGCSYNPLASDCLCCVGFCLPWTYTTYLFEVRVGTKLDSKKCLCILPTFSFFLSFFILYPLYLFWFMAFCQYSCISTSCGRQCSFMRAVMLIFVWARFCVCLWEIWTSSNCTLLKLFI